VRLLRGRYSGASGPGPGAVPTERLHAVVVDQRRLHGRVTAYHGTSIARRARTTAQARERSLVAVNGGFFTNAATLTSVAGVQTGLGVYRGGLQSLANGGRAALVLDGRHGARIRNVRTRVRLHVAGRSVRVRGVNRQLGMAQDCGVKGFMPTQGPPQLDGSRPLQGGLCTGPDDLVLFTSMFGTTLPPLPAGCADIGCMQVLLDAAGRVVCPSGETPVPADGSAIQASGRYARRLARLLELCDPTSDARVIVTQRLYDAHGGDRVAVRGETSIASAAPILLRDGRLRLDATREGIPDTFLDELAGRTMAGIDRHGRLLLVTADGPPATPRGPQPASSGVTMYDGARIMRRLGAVTAMNLDGGGSTTFVVHGQLRNVPTDPPSPDDPTGERAVGDTIQVLACRRCQGLSAGHPRR
jgi:hypothetical protein